LNLLTLSNTGFIVAIFGYIFSFVAFVIAITGQRFSKGDVITHTKRWSRRGIALTFFGLAAHLTYFISRWIYNHYPNSNLFEFMAMLAMLITVAFIVLYMIFKSPYLGAFAMPISFFMMAYASVFPWETKPLIPALQSVWLYVHVTTAALGEAFFAIGFAAGLMFLLRTINYHSKEKKDIKEQRGMELVMISFVIFLGFIIAVFGFRATGYEAKFIASPVASLSESAATEEIIYNLPPIFSPTGGKLVAMDSFLGIDKPVMESPSFFKGVNAARKLNTVVWSLFVGFVLYIVLRLLVRKPLGLTLQPLVRGLNPEDLDEISYRSIAIGYPIFTLGALIFAMIWAEIAWSRFWGWDPKEVWALISWLFYSFYLHVRLSRGWQGSYSSWLAVIGFIVIMFTLIGVNLVIAGLHSYAGV
jgi:ABC-type transport system involved in cytochrome c biogenesis permease subunit